MCAVCVCIKKINVCTRVFVRGGLGEAVCNPLKEKARAPPSWGSLVQQLVSFIHALLMSISSMSALLVPGPALRAGVSLGPGTHPILP